MTLYAENNPRITHLNSLLAELICWEGLPFSLVELSAFRQFIHELDPCYAIPDRHALSERLVPQCYEAVKSDIKASSSIPPHVPSPQTCGCRRATAPSWGSRLDDFVANNKCLAVRPAPGSHTADFIASELEAMLTEWSITKSAVNVVTDSGASVKKAVSQMGIDRWHPCYAAAVREHQHGSQGCY